MRLVLVALIVVLLVLASRWYASARARDGTPIGPLPRVPRRLLAGAERTWVVFTTPFCATCGPVRESLAAADPTANVVTVDATREPALADAFVVRSAPTVVLANAAGDVEARLVGPEAVRQYLTATAV